MQLKEAAGRGGGSGDHGMREGGMEYVAHKF